LQEYVNTAYVVDSDLFRVMGHGEDWATLEKLIEASDVDYREEALEIIRSEENPDLREKKLKELQGGAPYMDMFANFFTKLRRSDYELHYTMIPFTIEEGKVKLETAPSQLSLNEMFLIAQTYPVGSPEFRKVFDIATSTYPDSEIANFNAAANALDISDVETAQKYMNPLETRDAAWYNNMGVLAGLQGNHDEAAGYFKKAAEQSNREAVANLAEIGKVKK
jgi:tetratricopeptide (TPR) repeat protein